MSVLRYGMMRDLVLGTRSGARRRARAAVRAGAAQGQHRLRREIAVHRRGGHARNHHGGESQALSADPLECHRVRRGARYRRRGHAARRAARRQRRPGEFLRAHSAHRRGTCRAPHPRRRRSARPRLIRWYVLCELTSSLDEDAARRNPRARARRGSGTRSSCAMRHRAERARSARRCGACARTFPRRSAATARA